MSERKTLGDAEKLLKLADVLDHWNDGQLSRRIDTTDLRLIAARLTLLEAPYLGICSSTDCPLLTPHYHVPTKTTGGTADD